MIDKYSLFCSPNSLSDSWYSFWNIWRSDWISGGMSLKFLFWSFLKWKFLLKKFLADRIKILNFCWRKLIQFNLWMLFHRGSFYKFCFHIIISIIEESRRERKMTQCHWGSSYEVTNEGYCYHWHKQNIA